MSCTRPPSTPEAKVADIRLLTYFKQRGRGLKMLRADVLLEMMRITRYIVAAILLVGAVLVVPLIVLDVIWLVHGSLEEAANAEQQEASRIFTSVILIFLLLVGAALGTGGWFCWPRKRSKGAEPQIAP